MAYADDAKKRMAQCIEALKENFAKVRSGRANPHILDSVMVDYYGTPTAINKLAAVRVSEATNLVVEPWDKSTLSAIEKAICASDIGITPNNDGSALRLPFPSPTEERRRELTRDCKALAEEAKVAVRRVRQDVNGKISRSDELTDDDKHRAEKGVQKETDAAIQEIDKLLSAKTAEIMEI